MLDTFVSLNLTHKNLIINNYQWTVGDPITDLENMIKTRGGEKEC